MEKKLKTVTYMITPCSRLMKAPSIAVTVQEGKYAYASAIEEAKKISRLSDFSCWNFI